MDERDWDTENDGDGNGHPGDYFGWNFNSGGSPNIVANTNGHGAYIMQAALSALYAAGEDGDRVRIMYVIGTGTQIADYVVDQKTQRGVNIVAVSNSTGGGGTFSRENAEDLRDEGILLFVGSKNTPVESEDRVTHGVGSFYHATPRRGIQLPAVETILPVTTDPVFTPTAYGINSFYFAASGVSLQSYAIPIAAVYSAVAAQAYQDFPGHNGQTPSAMQIKRAMMSGVSYASNLNNKTITYRYVDDVRQDGGVLDLSSIISSSNQASPEITGVSITQDGSGGGTLGNIVQFELFGIGSPPNWTISWGDNSGVDESGVEVVPGDQTGREHTFPFFENAVHHYYPTIYAMSDTDQVYLQSSQMPAVTITTPFAPTSGADHYRLYRDGNNIVLTLGTSVSHSFSSTQLPTLIMTLGAGDTLTVDFSTGNVLEYIDSLSVIADGAGGAVRVIGTSGADNLNRGGISGTSESFSVEAPSFSETFVIDANLAVTLDGAGGDDTLSAGNFSATLIGGAGDDELSARPVSPNPVRMEGGDDDDTITGGAAADTILGGDGIDSLTGGAGNDCIYGGNGNDRLFGDAGNDGIYGENGNDSITGGSGSDYMSGGAGNDDFNARDGEVDTLDGGSGSFDTAYVDNDMFNWVFDEDLNIETILY